jgi:hypothetical protein
LDGVLEVDEKGQVGDAAVVVAVLTEYLEAGAGECGLVEWLGGADLMGFDDLLSSCVWRITETRKMEI